jgi:hypothetical protein
MRTCNPSPQVPDQPGLHRHCLIRTKHNKRQGDWWAFRGMCPNKDTHLCPLPSSMPEVTALWFLLLQMVSQILFFFFMWFLCLCFYRDFSVQLFLWFLLSCVPILFLFTTEWYSFPCLCFPGRVCELFLVLGYCRWGTLGHSCVFRGWFLFLLDKHI